WAPLGELGVDFSFEYQSGKVGRECSRGLYLRHPRVQVITRTRRWPVMELSLLGEHRAANAAVAVAAIETLRSTGWHIPDEAVAEGLSQVSWPARLEIVGQRPLVVLDCAHNVASALALVKTLETSFDPT